MPVDPYMIDDENPELTDDQIRAMRPASEVLPPALYAKLVARTEARRSGAKEAEKEAVVMHLDPALAARLRAAGPGWEERAEDLLRKAVGL